MTFNLPAGCHARVWTPAQVETSHALRLDQVLGLLSATEEVQAVGRMLELLRCTLDAGRALAVEYVLQGSLLKVRQVVSDSGTRVPVETLGQDLDGSRADSAHALLVALAGGQQAGTMIGLCCPAQPRSSCSRPVTGGTAGPGRVSLLYALTANAAWALHFSPSSQQEGLAPDVLVHLPACGSLVCEAHRIVSPTAANDVPRVDSAEVRLGVRAAALSGRERQICARIAGGLSAHSIAAELGIALSTVVTLRKRAYAKLGIHARLDLRHLAA